MNPFHKLTLVSLPLVDYHLHSTAYTKILPPIGLGYLATAAGKAGFDVEIIDAENEKLSMEQLVDRVLASEPSLVGVSIPSPLVKQAKMLIDRVKYLRPHCTVVVGGNHPSIILEKILTDIPNIDVVFVGESEESFVQFAKGVDKSNIKGIIYWDDNNDIRSTGRPDNVDIDALPILDRKYFKNDPWRAGDTVESYICSSRGCPFKCTYCSAGTIQGKTIRRRSIASIMDEIKYLVDTFGTNYLHFVDDNFVLSRGQAYEFCNALNAMGSRTREDARPTKLVQHAVSASDVRACPVSTVGVIKRPLGLPRTC